MAAGRARRSAIELRQNRELPLVDAECEVVWKLRLGPLYLTTRSASLELGLLGTRQRAGLRCGAMLSWIVLAFLAHAGTRWYKRRGLPLVSVRAVLLVFDFTQGYIWEELLQTGP